jgi:hypothetical protein
LVEIGTAPHEMRTAENAVTVIIFIKCLIISKSDLGKASRVPDRDFRYHSLCGQTRCTKTLGSLYEIDKRLKGFGRTKKRLSSRNDSRSSVERCFRSSVREDRCFDGN